MKVLSVSTDAVIVILQDSHQFIRHCGPGNEPAGSYMYMSMQRLIHATLAKIGGT